MNTQDLNPLLDPENLLIPTTHDGAPSSQAQLNVDAFDVLGSVDRSLVMERNEEPPWLAEFLVHYKLLFGNGQTETADKDRAQPIPIADPPAVREPVSPTNREKEDIEQRPFVQVTTSEKEEKPRDTLQFRASKGWGWIHFAIAVTLAALLFALMFMLGLAYKQKLDIGLAAPMIGTHLGNLQAVPAVSSPTSVADLDSQADTRLTAPLRKTLPTYPSAALAEKLEGSVSLRTYISPGGQVTGVTILSGDPILARAAVAAVWQWVYPPSKQDEVRQQQVTIRFRVP